MKKIKLSVVILTAVFAVAVVTAVVIIGAITPNSFSLVQNPVLTDPSGPPSSLPGGSINPEQRAKAIRENMQGQPDAFIENAIELDRVQFIDIPVAQLALDNATTKLTETTAKKKVLDDRIDATKHDYDVLQTMLQNAGEDFDFAKATLAESARDDLRSNDISDTFSVFTGEKDSREFVDDLEVANAISRTESRLMTKSANDLSTGGSASSRLEAMGKKLNELELEAKANEDSAVAAKATADKEVAHLANLQANLSARNQQFQAEAARRAAEIADQARRAAEAAARAAAAANAAQAAEDAKNSPQGGGGGASPTPGGGGSDSGGGGGSLPPAPGGSIVAVAQKYLGVPYVYGGTTPAGFDCSGLVQYVYREAVGKSLPRTTGEMATAGQHISRNQAVPGDVVYWDGHVGIYIGGGMMIHAPIPGRSVEYSVIWTGETYLRF